MTWDNRLKRPYQYSAYISSVPIICKCYLDHFEYLIRVFPIVLIDSLCFVSAWIEEPNIKPYQEFKDQLIKSCKTAAFKDAISQIEEYIVNPEVSIIKFYITSRPKSTITGFFITFGNIETKRFYLNIVISEYLFNADGLVQMKLVDYKTTIFHSHIILFYYTNIQYRNDIKPTDPLAYS